MRRMFQAAGLALLCALTSTQLFAQPLSGMWELSLKRSKLETKHTPAVAFTITQCNGNSWSLSRVRTYPEGPDEHWSVSANINARVAIINQDLAAMRVNREGKEVVLRTVFTNEDRHMISTVIHYRVLDHGHTLVEDEWILAPDSSEHNLWVSTRMRTQAKGRKKP